MEAPRRPVVLLVDDKSDMDSTRVALMTKGIEARARHPEDVELPEVIGADLIVVDHQLDTWGERDAAPPARRPADGVAVASVLKRQIPQGDEGCTAFAILTGQVNHLAPDWPAEQRHHVLANAIGVEWVFLKNEKEHVAGICDLARAAHGLPSTWPDDQPARWQKLAAILNLPEEPWAETAREDIASCLPPLDVLTRWSHGIVLLRWLLHRVLPYPTFLIGSYYVAARLRVSLAEFNSMVAADGPLREALRPCEYSGMLSGFLGMRWWRAGLEWLLWDQTGGQSGDTDALREVVRRWSDNGTTLDVTDEPLAVCLDSNLRATDQMVPLGEAVRLQPDDWPAYALPAWASRSAVSNDARLRALAVPSEGGTVE